MKMTDAPGPFSEQGEERREVTFGPDSASYATVIGGIPLLLGTSIFIAVLNVKLSGISVLLFLFGGWYLVRCITVSRITIQLSGLEVRSPIRTFEANWHSIAEIRRAAFIRIHSTAGQIYKVPLYSESPLTVLLMKYLGSFKSHHRLDATLQKFKKSAESTSDVSHYHFSCHWTLPSRRFLIVTSLITGAVEAVAFIRI